MTEEQKYDVVQNIGNGRVEIRRYHACTMADTDVIADYRNAGNMGFRPLVTYISRNNIAMTAPVLQQQNAAESWKVSFVMPEGMKLSDLPLPQDSKVTLREVKEHLAAALTFSGVTTPSRVQAHEKQLREILAASAIRTIEPLRIARFDPPWKPGFMRRNEVVLQIEDFKNGA